MIADLSEVRLEKCNELREIVLAKDILLTLIMQRRTTGTSQVRHDSASENE